MTNTYNVCRKIHRHLNHPHRRTRWLLYFSRSKKKKVCNHCDDCFCIRVKLIGYPPPPFKKDRHKMLEAIIFYIPRKIVCPCVSDDDGKRFERLKIGHKNKNLKTPESEIFFLSFFFYPFLYFVYFFFHFLFIIPLVEFYLSRQYNNISYFFFPQSSYKTDKRRM